jgi:DNA invertase Pin-like site-specific DNA recombinase
MSRPMRALLYARASTRDKQHPEHQLEELRRIAEQREWTVVREGIELASGAQRDRILLGNFLGELEAGRANVLAAVSLSRISRSLHHLLELSGQLKAWHAELVITRQHIDTTTPAGRFLFHHLGAAAELERDLIAESVAAGVASARRRRGGAWGPVRVVTGGQIALARELRAQGKPWPEVAAAVGHPESTLRDAIRATHGEPPGDRPPNPAKEAGLDGT